MAYQLSDIISRVQQRIRDTGYSSLEITNYINDAQNDIFNEYRLPFMQTYINYSLVANVPDITNGSTLPANYVQAVDLSITTTAYETLLEYISYERLNEIYPSSDNITTYPASIPQYWYIYDNVIKVFPAPVQAFTVKLRYWQKPTELASSTDVPSIPSEFKEVLVVGAGYRCLQVKDNYDQAAILQNKYDELLQKLVVKYSVPQTGKAIQMRINKNAVGKTNF
jgi:hypothetical protein